MGENKPHLTSLVHRGHIAEKMKHKLSWMPVSAQFKALISMFFPFTPPLFNPPYPFLLCWQTVLISYELAIDTSYLGEKQVCPQQVNMWLPHPPKQTHDTFPHSLPDNTVACGQNQRRRLSHAIRAENTDDEVPHTKETWGSEGCNERWLEVEALADELQSAGETNPSQ